MQKDYLATISYHRLGQKHTSGFNGGDGTLDKAIRELVYMRDYLANVGKEEGIPIVFSQAAVVCRCAKCYGDGTIRKPKKGYIYGKEVTCPDCKGSEEGKEFSIIDLA